MTAEINDSKSLDTGSNLAPTTNLNAEIQSTWGPQTTAPADKQPAQPAGIPTTPEARAGVSDLVTKAPTPEADKDVIFVPIMHWGSTGGAGVSGSAGEASDSGAHAGSGGPGGATGSDSINDGAAANPGGGGGPVGGAGDVRGSSGNAASGAGGERVDGETPDTGSHAIGGESLPPASGAGHGASSGHRADAGLGTGSAGSGSGAATEATPEVVGIVPHTAPFQITPNSGIVPGAEARMPGAPAIPGGAASGTDATVSPDAGNVDPAMEGAAVDISARTSLDIPQSMIKNASAQWTVAIELGATLPGTDDQPLGAGVEHQLPQLLALAKETTGKPVNFVVHAQRLVDSAKEPVYDGSNITSVTNAEAKNALQAGTTETERYFIHDGKIDELPTVTYGDGASDIAGLLNDAGMAAPADKLALVIQSHGGGTGGIGTNIGSLSLNDTMDAIRTGLGQTFHDKLDLLDFDGCDMAEAKVMSASKDVANDVVASSVYEIANSKNDGQNLQAGMRALLADPSMTAGQFGDKLVQQAAAGVDGVGQDAAVQTLTNLNLTKYDDFNASLGNFGKALSASATNPDNMKVLKADIDNTPVPSTGYSEMNSNERDLKTFAQTVLADAEAGHLTGDVKPLEDSARALLTNLDGMVTSTYGDKGHNYDKLGGLTIALPGSEVTDSKRVARELSPVHQLDSYVAGNLAEGPQLDFQESVTNNFDSMLIKLPKALKQQFPDEIKQMQTADDAVRNAPDVTSYSAALAHLHDVTTAVDSGPMGTAAMETPFVTGMAKVDQKASLAKPLERLAPDWTNFVSLERLQVR
jgi:hypothetical protein